jgi:hypothetical protein
MAANTRARARFLRHRGLAVLACLVPLAAGNGCGCDKKGLSTPRPGTGGWSGPAAAGGTTSPGGGDAAPDGNPALGMDSNSSGGTGPLITAGTGGMAVLDGSPANGGAGGSTTGSGGTVSPGGVVGTGGATGTGGAAIDAGVPPSTGGALGGSDAPGAAGCSFEVTGELSAKIPTVGIVTWSTSLASLAQAHIDFGLTTTYGMTAPVDPKATGNRTLLLGMKPERTYHYRIVASDGTTECTSNDHTLTTGILASGLQPISVSTKSTASPISGGFLVVGSYEPQAVGLPSVPGGYILDADGDPVWAAFDSASDTACVRMDYAGTHMWLSSVNIPNTSASVHRMTMDGLSDEDLSSKFDGQHLRLTVLPDETVAFAAYDSNGCDDIKEYSPSGTVKTVVNAGAAQGLTGFCQVVDVQYSKDDDTLVFSDVINRSLVKVRRSDGATVWVLGGTGSTLTGDTWQGGQWGLHVLGHDRVLLFATNSRMSSGSGHSTGTGDGSSALEMSLDVPGKTATRIWSYKSSIQNDVFGDVQRLPGGNTIIAFPAEGKLQEVDASGSLLQEWNWPSAYVFGYVEKRPTLYGPPPR